MKKWKILLSFLYVLVLIIGFGSYFYDLSKNSNNDLPLGHRLAVTLLFLGFTLLQWIVYTILKKKIPTYEEKISKRAYLFLQGLSIAKVFITSAFDIYIAGNLSLIFICLLPFTIGNPNGATAIQGGILSIFIAYLPWILCVGGAWLIETILLNKIFNVKGKGLLRF